MKKISFSSPIFRQKTINWIKVKNETSKTKNFLHSTSAPLWSCSAFEQMSKKTLIFFFAKCLASQNCTFLEILTHCELESYLKKETQQLIERLKADFPAILSVFFLHRKSRVGRNTPRAIILAWLCVFRPPHSHTSSKTRLKMGPH